MAEPLLGPKGDFALAIIPRSTPPEGEFELVDLIHETNMLGLHMLFRGTSTKDFDRFDYYIFSTLDDAVEFAQTEFERRFGETLH